MTTIDLNEYLNLITTDKPTSAYTISTYRQALDRCKLSTVDTENVPGTWAYLLSRLKNYLGSTPEGKTKGYVVVDPALITTPGYIRSAMTVCKAALKFNGIPWVKEINYNTLLLKLPGNKKIKEYTDSEVTKILEVTYGHALRDGGNLFRGCLLMALSGLRIGGVEAVKFEDFKQIDNDVWVYPVTSKGRTYQAAISNWGHEELLKSAYPKNDVPQDNGYLVKFAGGEHKTPFEKRFRKNLRTLLHKNNFRPAQNGQSINHSLRHWANHKLRQSPTITKDDRALLMGRSTGNDTEAMFYVAADKTRIPTNIGWDKYVADTYKRSLLNEWRLW